MSEASEPTNDPAQLFLANQRLVPFIVNRYLRPDTRELRDEMDQEGRVGLWNACLTYDPSKGSFGTYAAVCIRHQILRWLRSTKGERTLANLSEPLDDPLLDDGDLTLQDTIPSTEDVAAEVEDRDLRRALKRYRALRLAVAGLSAREIAKRFRTSPYIIRKRIKDEYRRLIGAPRPRRKKRSRRP